MKNLPQLVLVFALLMFASCQQDNSDLTPKADPMTFIYNDQSMTAELDENLDLVRTDLSEEFLDLIDNGSIVGMDNNIIHLFDTPEESQEFVKQQLSEFDIDFESTSASARTDSYARFYKHDTYNGPWIEGTNTFSMVNLENNPWQFGDEISSMKLYNPNSGPFIVTLYKDDTYSGSQFTRWAFPNANNFTVNLHSLGFGDKASSIKGWSF